MTDAARREQIRPVLSYVEQHCRERVTLQEVAEVARSVGYTNVHQFYAVFHR